jgi:plastocyanin
MKYIITVLLVLGLTTCMQAKRYIVTNAGFTFSPATLNVEVGDSVIFQLASAHDVVEVSQATWDANGSQSNGGFQLPFGGGIFSPKSAGTIYYVCEPHSSFGMKGMLIVRPKSTTAVDQPQSVVSTLNLQQNAPNPLNSSTTGIIAFSSAGSGPAVLKVYDLLGAERGTVFQGNIEAGRVYDARIQAGSLPAGIYVYRLEQGRNVATRVMTLTK